MKKYPDDSCLKEALLICLTGGSERTRLHGEFWSTVRPEESRRFLRNTVHVSFASRIKADASVSTKSIPTLIGQPPLLSLRGKTFSAVMMLGRRRFSFCSRLRGSRRDCLMILQGMIPR